MQGKNSVIFDAITVAMEAEKKASAFYTEAIPATSNERGKNLLKQLANFEQKHYDALNELKNSLASDGKFINYQGTQFESFNSEITSEVSGKIETNKDDMLNILILAIDAESMAHKRYQQMADETSDPRGKAMFKKLAAEEILHRRILSDEFYHLNQQGGVWSWGD